MVWQTIVSRLEVCKNVLYCEAVEVSSVTILVNVCIVWVALNRMFRSI